MRSLIAKLVLTSQGPFKFSISRALYSIRRSWHARSIWIDWRLKENGIFISVDLSLSNICPTSSSSRGYEILARAIWRLPLLSMVDIFISVFHMVQLCWGLMLRCLLNITFGILWDVCKLCTFVRNIRELFFYFTTPLVCFLVYLWNFAFHFAFWTFSFYVMLGTKITLR